MKYLFHILLAFRLWQSAHAAERPNIVIMLADDLGYGDLSCYGHDYIRTPNIDRLAGQGWRCTQFYAAAPMCSPSRAGLLTGRTPNRTGVFDWIAHDGTSAMHLPRFEITIATLLRQSGYQTALHGKWHLNSRFNSPEQPQPNDHGFDYWFATQFSPNHLNPKGFVRNGKSLGRQEGYACQIVVDDAIRWLQQRDTLLPFFQFVSFHEPHHPVASPPNLVQKHLGSSTKKKNKAIYFANVENLDAAVGRYLKTLDELAIAENTIVIFTSDHGPQSLGSGIFQHSYGRTGDLRGRKRYLWEGGLRVPGIIRWPGKLMSVLMPSPISFVDLLPTFAEISGYEVPSDRVIDGTSVVPLMMNKPFIRSKPLHWHFYSPLAGPQSVIREGKWMLGASWSTGLEPFKRGTRHISKFEHLFAEATLMSFQLFDIEQDSSQENDIAIQHPAVVKRLSRRLIELHNSVKTDSK